jgi:hypothetical protein
LLEFSDPLFDKIGASFIKEYEAEFGPTDHLYNCDTFNEMSPATNDTTYLANSGKAIYRAMTAADPDAVWVMQGWMFYFAVSNLAQTFIEINYTSNFTIPNQKKKSRTCYHRLTGVTKAIKYVIGI